jgi:hypothetical protein
MSVHCSGIGDCCFLSFPLSRIMYGRYRIDFCESVSISLWILSFSRLFGLFVCVVSRGWSITYLSTFISVAS